VHLETAEGGAYERLSQRECLAYLHSATFGYLATTARALPVIVAVKLGLCGGDILVEPLVKESLTSVTDSVVALAVGMLHPGDPAMYSVHAQGFLRAAPAEVVGWPTSPLHDARPRGLLHCEVVDGWRRSARTDEPKLRSGPR
jgi:hypothetical protein